MIDADDDDILVIDGRRALELAADCGLEFREIGEQLLRTLLVRRIEVAKDVVGQCAALLDVLGKEFHELRLESVAFRRLKRAQRLLLQRLY